jgi:hypothetical protein
MKVTTYKYEKVPVKDTELFIPEKPFYCFQTGIRRAIRIIPTFVDWESSYNKLGDPYELEVTCVYSSFECKIEKFNIRINQIEDNLNMTSKSQEKEIINMLLNEDYGIRTKEQFECDLNENIRKISQ